MTTINDLQLCESLLKVQQLAGKLNRFEREAQVMDLWRALGEIHRQSQLAMYRLMDMGK